MALAVLLLIATGFLKGDLQDSTLAIFILLFVIILAMFLYSKYLEKEKEQTISGVE